jgi:hypothetical protein
MGLFTRRDQAVSANGAPLADRTWRMEPVTTHVAAPGAYEVRPAFGSLTARILLTLAGAATMIISTFLTWFDGARRFTGNQLSARAFSPVGKIDDVVAQFSVSAGVVVMVLAALALIGLALSRGWLTRLAGALAIVAAAGFVIRLAQQGHEGRGLLNVIGPGAWLLAAAGLATLIGGFMGTARSVVVPDEHDVVTGHRTVVVEED